MAHVGRDAAFCVGRAAFARVKERFAHDASTMAIAVAAIFELIVAVYGGYFGGGVGIMNLAMLAALGMTDIHAMNALKVLLGGIINAMAVVTFIVARAIAWKPAAIMTAGARSVDIRRALRAEVTAIVDSSLCDRGRDGDDDLFLLESLLNSAQIVPLFPLPRRFFP